MRTIKPKLHDLINISRAYTEIEDVIEQLDRLIPYYYRENKSVYSVFYTEAEKFIEAANREIWLVKYENDNQIKKLLKSERLLP